MPYPSAWAVGDVLGRNLIARPNFSDGATATSVSPWLNGAVVAADLGSNGGSSYAISTFTRTNVATDAAWVYAPDAQLKVWVLCKATVTGCTITHGATYGTSALSSSNQLTVSTSTPTTLDSKPIPVTSDFQWQQFTLTMPPATTVWKNGVNATTVPTKAIIAFTAPASGNLSVAAIRVDEPDSPVDGYFDGSTADSTLYDYGWAGTTLRSLSTAKALTAANQPPTASFTSSVTDLSVAVDASASTDPDGTIASYGWDWGDSSALGTGAQASHIYGEEGTYTVTLTVTDNLGATGTSTATVSVTKLDVPAGAPTGTVTALIADVVRFMGRTGDPGLESLAAVHVPVIAEMVSAYVRGHGVKRIGLGLGEMEMGADLRAVVITASARLLANPAQLDSESADGYAARGSFSSFSLAEQAILHRYRRRAA